MVRPNTAILHIRRQVKRGKYICRSSNNNQARARLVFRLSLICSKYKFKFSVGIQLFGLKITSHGKSDLKNAFFLVRYIM